MDSLLEIIDLRLLPWTEDRDDQRIVWTGSPVKKTELPKGVRITRRVPRGPRKVMRTKRAGSHPEDLSAIWPRDGLCENAGAPLVACAYDGHIDFWAGDMVVHCAKGHFLLLPPGIRHSYELHYDHDPKASDDRQFCNFLWIGRWGRVIRCWTCHCVGAVHHAGETDADFMNETANTLLDFLMTEAQNGRSGWQAMCQVYLRALLTTLRRDLDTGDVLSSSRLFPEVIRSQNNDSIELAIIFIKNNLRDALTINAVARRVGMARTHFIQQFQRQTGRGFSRYLTECRIEEAKQLLLNSNWPVGRIREFVGLRSASYFTQLFTLHVGMSPREYRRTVVHAPTRKR